MLKVGNNPAYVPRDDDSLSHWSFVFFGRHFLRGDGVFTGCVLWSCKNRTIVSVGLFW